MRIFERTRPPGKRIRLQRLLPATPRAVPRRPAASQLTRQKSLPAHDDGGPSGWQGRLHGKDIFRTRQVPLAVATSGFGPDPNGGQRAGFSATAQINRGDFGIGRWTGGGAVPAARCRSASRSGPSFSSDRAGAGCRTPAARPG